MYRIPLILLVTMIFLSGCTTNILDQTDWCKSDHLILISNQDILTPGTKRQILEHDDAYSAYCS